MRINYLVLAHKNLRQLKRLITRLSEDNPADFRIYIHLDKKWNLNQEEINSLLTLNEKITIIPSRISCKLDDWSLIEAELKLLEAASEKNTEDTYFVMMSGQDYPIKTHKEFLEYCKENYPTPLIDITPWAKNNWVNLKFMNSPLYKLLSKYAPKNKTANFCFRVFRRGLDTLIPYNFKMKHRMEKLGVKLYGGSQWWVLPIQVINEILQEVKTNNELIKNYKITLTPDETFFQTMTMRTTLASRVRLNAPDQVWQDCPTFAYFNPEGTKFTGHPYTIDQKAWEKEVGKKKNYFFARKFDESIDSGVFETIDKEIFGK